MLDVDRFFQKTNLHACTDQFRRYFGGPRGQGASAFSLSALPTSYFSDDVHASQKIEANK